MTWAFFYTSKGSDDVDKQVENIFKFLSSQENDIVRPKTLSFMGRNVTFQKCCGQVLDSSFSELCDRVSVLIFLMFQNKRKALLGRLLMRNRLNKTLERVVVILPIISTLFLFQW